MSENITIYYNNVDLLNGIGPVPFVTSSQEFIDYSNKWNQITKLQLEGVITGKYLGSLSNQYLNESFNILLQRLSNNYGNLGIKQNNDILFSGNSVIIDSINIENDNWYGILPYTINIDVYETGLFENYYGVTSPQETISFNEDDGELITLTHKISARGLVTNNTTPLENAKNWVLTRTGYYNKVIPALIKTGNGSNFLLESINENINRFSNEYSWEASYIKSINNESPKNSLFSYSIDINSGIEEGLITVDLQGSLEKNSIENLRLDYNNINFHSIANNSVTGLFKTSLNTKPISKSITESEDNNILDFSFTFNNDFDPTIVNDYSVEINKDALKNIADVSLNADIFGRYGDISSRWNDVKNYFETEFKPFNLANTEYLKEINKPLSSNILTESITFDEYNAKITYTATWSNKRQLSSDILNFSSSVTYTPSIRLYAVNTSAFVSRKHNIQNINTFNRSKLEIEVSVQVKPDNNINISYPFIDSEISRIKSNYQLNGNILLEDKTIKTNPDLNNVTVTEIWTFEGGKVE
jgi:hypothetical protein